MANQKGQDQNKKQGQNQNQDQDRNQASARQNTAQQSTSQQGTAQQSTAQKNQQSAGERNALNQNSLGDNNQGQIEQQASYWRDQYKNEPYVTKGQKFEEYSPAYRTGYEGRSQYAGQRFEDVESNLEQDYTSNRGDSKLGWDNAKQACRAAWDRADQFVSSSQADRKQDR